jgi:hypothetical protein
MTTSTTTTQKQAFKDKFDKLRKNLEDSPGSQIFAYILLFTFLALLLKVIAVNLAPFALVVGDSLPAPSRTPIIGWLLDVMNILYTSMGAFILWAVINVFELGWIFVEIDSKAKRAAIKKSRAEQDYFDAMGNKDDRHTRKERKKAIQLPFFYKAVAGYLALGAFVVDFFLNWRAFPLVTNWDAFWGAVTLKIMPAINWGNALQQLFNLFNMEIMVIAILATLQWIAMHKEGSQP